MILVDFSQVVFGSIIIGLKDQLKTPNADVGGMIRHLFFNTMAGFKRKFGAEFGEIVLCMDARHGYWRNDIFPYYKGDRILKKEASDIDFELVYKIIDELKVELRENFRYKIVEVQKAEADDIIAVLCKWLQTNELSAQGLFEGIPQKILIISGDGDYVQLQRYENVKQWAPVQKKFISPKGTILEYVREHITRAGDDNIPSIANSDQWSKDRMNGVKVRGAPVKNQMLKRFIEMGRDACENDEQRKNWDRNQRLIDFDFIPEDLAEKIVDTYIKCSKKGNQMKIMAYFSKHRFKQLLSQVTEF